MPSIHQQYERTFTSFGGPDIVPIFNNKIIGECQALTYSVRREKAQHIFNGVVKRLRRAIKTNISYIGAFINVAQIREALT